MTHRIKINKEEIRRLYWDEQLSVEKVAEKLEISRGTIQRRMKEFKIPTRSLLEARIIMYGEK